MRICYAATNGKTEAGTSDLGGKERIKDVGGDRIGDSRSGIRDVDYDPRQALSMLPGDSDREYALCSHRFDGIEEQVEEELFELTLLDGNKRCGILEVAHHGGARLLKLTTQQGQRIVDRITEVDCPDLQRRSSCNAAQTGDEIVDARYLLYDDLGEVLAKVHVAKAFWKQLGECANGDQGILDLMRHTRGECAKRGETFSTLLLSLELLQSTEVAKDDKGSVCSTVLVL